MNAFQALFLGILQGIAEFLPISSSGHLLISRQWMGLEDIPRLFDVLLHIASLIVILWVYRKKVGVLIMSLIHPLQKGTVNTEQTAQDRNNRRLILLLILSTLLTIAVVLGLEKSGISEIPELTGWAFLFTGFFLFVTRFLPEGYEKTKVSWGQSFLIGLAQGLGTLPGISRSGITIGTARFLGMEREKAGEYSFLLSIPAILGALALDLKEGSMLMNQISFSMLALAFITTLVVGYFSLTLLLKVIKKGHFHWFSFYLIPLGIIVLIFT